MVDSTNPRVLADNIRELAAREVGPAIEANPEGAATEDLEKLGIDGTVYGIPAPISVVANPEGEATADLTKLGINGAIYGIEAGANIVTYTTNVNVPANGFISSIPDETGNGTLNIAHAQILNMDYASYPSALRCFVTATGTDGAIGANVYDSTSMQKVTNLGNISVRATIIKY